MSKQAATPGVSVITPTYNRPRYLREAIESVVAQDMADWELLVINDGGEDVRRVVEAFDDHRIRYWHRSQNTGKAACLNFALEQVRGDYIAYLDDDDTWYPNHLSTLVDALDRHPRYGAAYTEPYEVYYLKGEDGRRIPLHKQVKLCRDFNRSFMFIFNHVLPISLMHRRGLGRRVGGYDEDVTVLIDWNLNRKLACITDFLHVPAVTGEHMVTNKDSDRISDLQREDMDEFRHNMRKIRADLPPEPWPKINRVAVILPVKKWDERTRTAVQHFTDDLHYPCRIVLVNQAPDLSESQCRDRLEHLGSLRHIHVVPGPADGTLVDGYRAGARAIEADYYYLASRELCPDAGHRLLRGLGYLKEKSCKMVRWEEDELTEPGANVFVPASLMDDEYVRPAGEENFEGLIPEHWMPSEVLIDQMVFWADRCLAEGDHRRADGLIQEARAVAEGGIGDPYLAQLVARACDLSGEKEKAGRLCEHLMDQGYVADNAIRLGDIEREKGHFDRATGLYEKGLDVIGISDQDLEDPALPAAVGEECGAYRALIGLGECYLELGESQTAASYLRRASSVRALGGRPALGFGRLFLRDQQPEEALDAFRLALRNTHGKRRAEAHAGMAVAYQKMDMLPRAWEHCRKAMDVAPEDKDCLKTAERVATQMGRWAELADFYEQYLEYRPGELDALRRLAELYRQIGRHETAHRIEEKTRILAPGAAVETGVC